MARICPVCESDPARRWSRHCDLCARARWMFSNYASGRTMAATEVGKARGKKLLPAPSEFACVDCDGQAVEYDHRDYGQPLNVAPVCRGCNLRRKSAKPIGWVFEEFMVWALAVKSRPLHMNATPEVLARLRRNHFTGPGGIADQPLRSA